MYIAYKVYPDKGNQEKNENVNPKIEILPKIPSIVVSPLTSLLSQVGDRSERIWR